MSAKLKLYEVDDGEQHWFSAASPVDAVMAYWETYGETDSEELSVSPIAEEKARQQKVGDDDDDSVKTLWDAWVKYPERGLVASSVW